MTTELLKEDRNAKQRTKMLMSRVVGLYRLMAEELSGVTNKIITTQIPEIPQNEALALFRAIVHEEAKHSIIDEMGAIIAKSRKETGSLKDLITPTKEGYPEQAVVVRLGSVMERAIRRFFTLRAQNISEELAPKIKEFVSRNILLDLAFKKDDGVVIAELKYNLKIDTEKINATIDKLDTLAIFMKKYYKEIPSTVCLVSLRYPTAESIPNLKPNLETVKGQYVIGYQELFNYFGVSITEDFWRALHEELGRKFRRAYKKSISN